MFNTILDIAAKIIALLASIVQAVESPGDGGAKKALAIAKFQEALSALPVPDWAKNIFGNAVISGILIDLIVSGLNKAGWLAANPT